MYIKNMAEPFQTTWKFGEHHCIILVQLLIISSLKSILPIARWVYHCSPTEQAGLNLNWSEILKDTFSRDVAQMDCCVIITNSQEM